MYRFVILSFITFISIPFIAYSQNAATLQQQINEKNKEIQQLQTEIDAYQKQVNTIASQAVTLESTLREIEANQKQLQKKIQLTNTNISKTNSTIQKNELRINDLRRGISSGTSAVEELLRDIQQTENQNFLEVFAAQKTLSETLNALAAAIKVQSQLKNNVIVMKDTKSQLEQAQKDLTLEKQKLEVLKSQLSDQEKLVAIQKNEQDQLLRETKNQESIFRTLLVDSQTKKNALDAEIQQFESQLQFILDPKKLPKQGTAVLGWPLSHIYITQQFGKTSASQRLYASGTHNGVDFRAPLGTPVFAVADGVIEGAGDTDGTCPRASFGKWIFIRHTNGLATTYGHLSLIKVREGQTVRKGELIGYSGNTGYSTGPHLHISVYASQGVGNDAGVRVMERPSTSCPGKVFRMPIAPTSAYLDPLAYMPKL